ncbi:hypothetical protein [Lacrimispora sp. 38-1]|uniref:hypothetical protein n=1 Tax=Lacrimispora sp. 38-1 TaxID=3125778 RepID=UPI003CFA3C34
MEESMQNTNKAKNMAAQEMRRIGLGEEVAMLVSEDIEYGLTTEEVYRYAKSGMNFKQMQIYSKCLRKHYSQEVIAVITADSLNANQMMVAFDFYEKGVPIETIKEVIQNKNNAFHMSQLFQEVLEQMENTEVEVQIAPEYVQSLFDEIKNVVSGIKFDESRFDELNEKLKVFETFKEDVAVRDNLVKQLGEKDSMLSEQQDKINQANSALARLREEKETALKEMKNMQTKMEALEENFKEYKKMVDQNQEQKAPIPKDDSKTLEEPIRGAGQSVSPQTIPFVYAMPAYCNVPVMDMGGNVLQTVSVEKVSKKSTNALIQMISRLLFKKKSRQDIVKLVVAGELIPAQLVLIRSAIEKGLTESQLVELINNKVPADQMKEIIEIAVLENELEEEV